MTESAEVRASGVVVGTDGSERNLPAVTWAAAAAAAHGVPLTLAFSRPDAAGMTREVTEASAVLDAGAEVAQAGHPDLDIRKLQFAEPPVQALLAASESADFVVLGSRGLDGFRGLLVGSTTMHVTPYARCPVVVVHEGHPSSEESSRPARHPGQVVLGYDGSPAANRASAFAFRHAAALGAGVVVVSVERGRGDPVVHDVEPEQAAPGSDTGAFHAPLLVTAGAFPSVPVTFVAGKGRPSEVLIQEGNGSELLVVGSRGLGGFSGLVMGSVSQKALAYATCPVAILHEGVGVAAKTAAGI